MGSVRPSAGITLLAMSSNEQLAPLITLDFERDQEEAQIRRSQEFYENLEKRRSIRTFSDEDVPKEVIANIIKAASTAPSGAHKQPWTFCVISDKGVKRKIREAAEEEEKINYGGRMSDTWLKDLEVFRTNWEKPFLEEAPYLIVVCKRIYELDGDGNKLSNYYVNESVGIATGMLIAAAHVAGLATLTHTPSPMNFLMQVLGRPKNERPFLLIPIGYPVAECQVPDLNRKALAQVLVEYA